MKPNIPLRDALADPALLGNVLASWLHGKAIWKRGLKREG
jgi:hypothetical protein